MNFSSFFSFGSFSESFTSAPQFQSQQIIEPRDQKLVLLQEEECINFTYKTQIAAVPQSPGLHISVSSDQIEHPQPAVDRTIKVENSRIAKVLRHHQISWLPTEDDLLVELYQKYGNKQWKQIADELNQRYRNDRSPTQCNQHYNRVVKVGLLKGRWTEEQDRLLREAIDLCGATKWKDIARYVGNRTDTQVRYRAMKQFPELYQ